MTNWTSDELDVIAGADVLRIAPLRGDGTQSSPTTVWVVRDGDDLYVRSYRGRDGAWYRTAQTTHQGHIHANGVDLDVTFTDETGPDLNDRIDAAYEAKYGARPRQYVEPMMAEAARATTLKLVPRASS